MLTETTDIQDGSGARHDARIYPDVGKTISKIIHVCESTRLPVTVICGAEEPNTTRQLEIRAIPAGEGNIVLILHDLQADEPGHTHRKLTTPVIAGQSGQDFQLTTRQLDVLRLIALGATDKEVAMRLGISNYTASKHVANILAKMHVSCRTEASVIALRSGLLSPPGMDFPGTLEAQ